MRYKNLYFNLVEQSGKRNIQGYTISENIQPPLKKPRITYDEKTDDDEEIVDLYSSLLAPKTTMISKREWNKIQKHAIDIGIKILITYFNFDETIVKSTFNFSNLTIDEEPLFFENPDPKNLDTPDKMVVLRKYNGENILIIGCGNGRLDNGNLGSVGENSGEYDSKRHIHKNCYTIDVAIVANPSVLCFFHKNTTFPFLKSKCFDKIILENINNDLVNKDEILRLCKEPKFICDHNGKTLDF